MSEPLLAYGIDEWCALRRISRGSLYNLEKRGEAPAMYRIGSRRFISTEADLAWQRQREDAAANTPRVDPKVAEAHRRAGAMGNEV